MPASFLDPAGGRKYTRPAARDVDEGTLNRSFTRRGRAVAPLLVALAACGGAGERPSADAAPVVATLSTSASAGAERIRAGDLAGARATYEAELARDPERLAALNDLAVSYSLGGHVEAARRLLDEVVAGGSAPEQQAALVNLGELYALEGYVSAAQAYFESARGIDATRPEPIYAIALLADARGETERARATLREAVRLDPDGAARSGFAFVQPEERVHLEALLAELAGDRAEAQGRWRELQTGRFASLSLAAERHLAE